MTDAPDPELLRRLEQAVLNMPKLRREVFLACRLDNMTYGEIAARTGLTIRQVERHIAKAIGELDRHLHGRKLRWWECWF